MYIAIQIKHQLYIYLHKITKGHIEEKKWKNEQKNIRGYIFHIKTKNVTTEPQDL